MRHSVMALLATTVTLFGTIMFVFSQLLSLLDQRLLSSYMYGESSLLLNSPVFTVSSVWLGVIVLGVILWCVVLYLEFRRRPAE